MDDSEVHCLQSNRPFHLMLIEMLGGAGSYTRLPTFEIYKPYIIGNVPEADCNGVFVLSTNRNPMGMLRLRKLCNTFAFSRAYTIQLVRRTLI